MDEISTDAKEKDNSGMAENHEFKTPMKCIKSAQDISIWETSEAYQVIDTIPYAVIPRRDRMGGGGPK